MTDFIREKVCFYSSVLKGQNSSWQIARSAAAHGVVGLELMNFSDELKTPDMKAAKEIGAFAKSLGLALPCFSCGVNFAEDTKARVENVKRYADILIALARSDGEGANKHYLEMLDFLSHMEAEYSLDFDLHLFARKMKSMLK